MLFEQMAKLVAENIKRMRMRCGLTQEKFSEKAGINYKFYQRVESGRSDLTLKTLSRISSVLKIHPKKFFEFE